jgi:hypothetical protein
MSNSKPPTREDAVKAIIDMTVKSMYDEMELVNLRKVRDAAARYMEVSYPCHCGELAPGPCCEECRRERELREALAFAEEMNAVRPK